MKDAGKAKKVSNKGEVKEKVNKIIKKGIQEGKTVVKKSKQLKVRNSKKATQANKDPNRPKRSLSAFFIFMDGFRKSFKEDHPEAKGLGVVAKAGGDKWKNMSESEKAPYVAKALEKKLEHEMAMLAYKQTKDEK